MRGTLPIALAGFFVSIGLAMPLYENDVMWIEQGLLLGLGLTTSATGLLHMSRSGLHALYWRDNAAVGLVRLACWLGWAWCLWVLNVHADSSIEGLWYGFYGVITFGFIRWLGLGWPGVWGIRLRVDVMQRGNLAAAQVIASFTLATALILGGSLWGESTEESLEYGFIFSILPSYGDGTWIVFWFFGLGWLALLLAIRYWLRSEGIVLRQAIVRNRDMQAARSFSLFVLACAIPLTDAVAGDYHGWVDSMLGFSWIALPVVAHEWLRRRDHEGVRSPWEGWIYLGVAIASVVFSPVLSRLLGLSP
jgi:hypothetical protein